MEKFTIRRASAALELAGAPSRYARVVEVLRLIDASVEKASLNGELSTTVCLKGEAQHSISRIFKTGSKMVFDVVDELEVAGYEVSQESVDDDIYIYVSWRNA